MPTGNGNRPAGPPLKSKVQSKGTGRQLDRPYEGTPLSMTGIRGGVLYSNAMKVVLLLLIAIFAVGFGMQSIGGFGGSGSGRSNTPNPAAAGPDPVAHVGSEGVSRDKMQNNLVRQLSMMEQFGQHTGAMDFLGSKQRVLQSLTDAAAQYQAAQAAGITVSEADIDQKINSTIDDEIKSEQGQNAAQFRRTVEAQYGSMDAYRDEERKKLDRDLVSRQLMVDKLEKQVKDANKVSEADYKQSVTKLELRQIIVRPKLASPTEKDQKGAQDKNAADAKARADKVFAEVKATPTLANFAAIAQKESDDIPTKSKGGVVGWKLPTELYYSTSIKDAIAKTNGPLVGPVQDDVSKDFYIFFVEGRKLELPKDYAKPKKTDDYIKGYKTTRDNEVWSKYQEDLKKKYAADIADPALAAYKTQTEQVFTAPPAQQAGLRQQALEKYTEALGYSGPLEKAAIYYQMAQLDRQMNKPADAVTALAAAVKEDKRDPMLGIDYARSLREEKKDKEALAQLQDVAKQVDQSPAPQGGMMMGGGNPNDQMHMQIASEYDALKRQDLATAERKKVKPPARSPMGGMGGLGGLGGSPINISPGGGGSKTITIPAKPG